MALRSGIGITEETDKEKDKQKTITRKVRGVDVVTKVPDDEVGGFTSAAAGVGSGIVKTVEGVVSLGCLLYTSPSPRDRQKSRMPSSA